MRCSIKTGIDYNDLWCNYRDLSYLEELRDEAFKLIRKELLTTINTADKLSKLGRENTCYYDDGLNFHYYIALLTLYRQDVDKYIEDCGCITNEVHDKFIEKYQLKCPISVCNADHTLFRKLYQLFLPKYGFCDDEYCIDWAEESECLCDQELPDTPIIEIIDIQNTELSFNVNTGGVNVVRIINSLSNQVLQTITNTASEYTITDLEQSTLYTIEVETYNCAGATKSNIQVQTTPITVTVTIQNTHPVVATSPEQGVITITRGDNFSSTIEIDNNTQPNFSLSGVLYFTKRAQVSTALTTSHQDLVETNQHLGISSGGSYLLTNIQYNTTVNLIVDKYQVEWSEEYKCSILNGENTGELKYKSAEVSYYGETASISLPFSATSAQILDYLLSAQIIASNSVSQYLFDTRIEENLVLCPVPPPISIVSIISNIIPDDNYITYDLSQSTTGFNTVIGEDPAATHNIKIYDSSNNLIYNQLFTPGVPTLAANSIWYENDSYIALNMTGILPSDSGTLVHTITYELQSGESTTDILRFPVMVSTIGNTTSTPSVGTYWKNNNTTFQFLAEATVGVITSITINEVEQTIVNPISDTYSTVITSPTTIIISD